MNNIHGLKEVLHKSACLRKYCEHGIKGREDKVLEYIQHLDDYLQQVIKIGEWHDLE